MEIDKIKREHYLEQLSGNYPLNEEENHEQNEIIEGLTGRLEEQLAAFKKEVQTTENYYKTDKKTKVQLFLIYIGLVIALTLSYYYGNEILMNDPEIQKAMTR